MVPALYDASEKEGIISTLRPQAAAAGYQDTKDGVWAYYTSRVRANLHVVLAMSPVGGTLRARCRNFPAMVNNTVIDWFEPWPEQVGTVGWVGGDLRSMQGQDSDYWRRGMLALVMLYGGLAVQKTRCSSKVHRDIHL